MSALEARNINSQYYANSAPSVKEFPEQERETKAKVKPQETPAVNILSVLTVFSVAFVMLFGILFMQGRIQQNNIAISKLKAEIEKVEDSNKDLREQIVIQDDVNAINIILREDPDTYGMRAPVEGQIVKVTLDDTMKATANIND